MGVTVRYARREPDTGPSGYALGVQEMLSRAWLIFPAGHSEAGATPCHGIRTKPYLGKCGKSDNPYLSLLLGSPRPRPVPDRLDRGGSL